MRISGKQPVSSALSDYRGIRVLTRLVDIYVAFAFEKR